METEPPYPGIFVKPLETNLLHAHFVLTGIVFYDTPYEGGVYHGVLKFPKEYPFQPPSIQIRTPSGRFAVDQRICFSMSDFHPESWSPSWTIHTILHGFVSFMNSDEITTGGVKAPAVHRIGLAQQSLEYCLRKDEIAMVLFESELKELQQERVSLKTWPPGRKQLPGRNSIEEESVAASADTITTTPSSLPTPSRRRRGRITRLASEEPEPAVSASSKNAAKNKKKRDKEKRKKMASKFLQDLQIEVPLFLERTLDQLQKLGIDVTCLTADHVCYRTDLDDQYTSLIAALRSTPDQCSELIESMVGGRLIATFKLATAIATPHHSVAVVEIPSPKDGSPYPAGLEHVEYVLPSSQDDSLSHTNDDQHQSTLGRWMEQHPGVPWNTKALHKDSNPDVSVKLVGESGASVSAKFHLLPLERVIELETKSS